METLNIEDLLRRNPGLEKSRAECVPFKMTEAEFWERYMHIQAVTPRLANVNANTNANQAAATASGDSDLPTDPKMLLLHHGKIDHLNNLCLREDLPRGYGIHNLDDPSKMQKDAYTIIRRFNWQGEKILTETVGPLPAEEEAQKHKEGMMLNDLLPARMRQPAPLTLTTTHAFAAPVSHAASRRTQAANPNAIKAFKTSVANWSETTDHMPSNIVDPNTACEVLRVVTDQILKMKHAQSRNDAMSKNGIQFKDERFEKDLHKYFAQATEYLRHFWGCFPITTPQQANKVERLKEHISGLNEELGQQLKHIHPNKQAHRHALEPILDSLKQAIDKFSTEYKTPAFIKHKAAFLEAAATRDVSTPTPMMDTNSNDSLAEST
eukprot:c9266_g1_i2.p1 GENE.c9266_g1_i2~~c9266_g1_i2.p1  ORF type:complete len:380 (-),score=96.88 c9266_g1_i2:1107-2246(-)